MDVRILLFCIYFVALSYSQHFPSSYTSGGFLQSRGDWFSPYQQPIEGRYGYQPPSQGQYRYQPPSQGRYEYQPPSQGRYGYQPPSQGRYGYDQPPTHDRYGYQSLSRSNYEPIRSLNQQNSFINQYPQYFPQNNRRYDSGSDDESRNYVANRSNPKISQRRRNPLFYSARKTNTDSKSGFGEAIVPGDCVNEQCCKENEMWDGSTSSCLKTSSVKIDLRRRSTS